MNPRKFRPIDADRRRLADAVYGQILAALRDGGVGGDDRLVQEAIAAEMGVSRTPVREALLRLEQEGILRVSRRGGFALRKMSAREVKELYQVRAAIEGQAARILAARGDGDEMKALRDAVVSAENLAAADVESRFVANRDVHRRIVEASANAYLLEVFDTIWNRATSLHLFSAFEPEDLSDSLDAHLRLIAAIASGDRTEALEETTRHIEAGLRLQLEALARRDGLRHEESLP